MSHEQLISIFGTGVFGLLVWSLIRNVRAFDKNIEAIWQKLNEQQEELHQIDARLGIAETQIKALEWQRKR